MKMHLRHIAHVMLVALMVISGNALAVDDPENYRLSESALQKYERATVAMYQFARSNPDSVQALKGSDEDDGDFNAMIRRMDQHAPGLRKAVEASGMKLEEYFVFALTLAGNAIGVAMFDQFGGNEAELTDLQRANMNFVRSNMERITRFDERMRAEYGDIMNAEEDEYAEEEASYYEDEEYGSE